MSDTQENHNEDTRFKSKSLTYTIDDKLSNIDDTKKYRPSNT